MPEDPPLTAPESDGNSRVQNHLVHEKSPYLLQHADNPVDWYPWGDEAFLRAVREEKPVFLSIGYATCHWCHVMAHESFEDSEIADLLNRDFISIKVDREERPDIDSVYMSVCQQMAGLGGWPLTIVMTPEKKPFFAATYIPKETRFSTMGLLTLLPRITRMWRERRSDLIQSGERVIASLASPGVSLSSVEPGVGLLEEGYQSLLLQFDTVYGGFGRAPKFPTPHILLFLLRYAKRNDHSRALPMVEKTLEAIRNGGIYDHLGGGVHRYSTDAQWHVPHFEKMLYDQALLVMAYTEAYQVTGNPDCKTTAEEIIGYVRRTLRSPEGAFFSAEDADSPDGEGAFYVWTIKELEDVLGKEDATVASLVFGAKQNGNYHDPERGYGYNILFRTLSPKKIAISLGIAEPELALRIESIRTRLFTAREQRVHPSIDDKVLSDWNGLCIAALARAGWVFDNPAYVEMAKTAMQFILTKVRSNDGGLLHRYRNGDAAIPGFSDDYAFIIHALIELYETTFDEQYLKTALSLNGFFTEHFRNTGNAGFFTVSNLSEALILQRMEIYDGAIPSGNSAEFMNLIRLSRLTGDAILEEQAAALARYFAGTVSRSPSAYSWFLCGLDLAVGHSHEIVIVGESGAKDTMAMVSALQLRYLPSVTILQFAPGRQESILSELAPFTRNLSMIHGMATAYICTGQACSKPVTNVNAMIALIDDLKKV
jgi:uncharacterized protein YyaL (SSP411 family)